MDRKQKQLNRKRRHQRIRALIKGTSKRPRVSVFVSNRNIFVQFIDDESGKTILSNRVSDLKKVGSGTKTDKSLKVGETLAQKAIELGIKEIVFDRGGFKYHGRVKALADGLRRGGLKF
jgi:large subunit ribosomal protein L18